MASNSFPRSLLAIGLSPGFTHRQFCCAMELERSEETCALAHQEWLESLIDSYPAWWIKNDWWEEGGSAGVWVGYHKNKKKIIKEIDWDDSCLEEILSRETVC